MPDTRSFPEALRQHIVEEARKDARSSNYSDSIATEIFADYVDDELRQHTMSEERRNVWKHYFLSLFDWELAGQQQAELRWPSDPTINDRITAAFAALEQSGIIALEDAGYTQSQGWEDVAGARQDMPEAWAGTFYHRQDVENGLLGDGLMLAFGSFDNEDKSTQRAASLIVSTLQSHGVPCTWSGDIDERITIEPFKWQKRRYTKPS